MPRTYPARPIVGVGAVVWKDGQVLLARRGKPPRMGEWSLPGGAQRVGERVFETARREVREEAGIEIEVVGLLDVIDSIDRDEAGRIRYHYTLVDVAARWLAGEARAGDDATEVRWFPADAVPSLGLWRQTERMIRLAADLFAGTDGR
jgi:ADP-ribose pyrophosphatase YjhB (NUDIX family)